MNLFGPNGLEQFGGDGGHSDVGSITVNTAKLSFVVFILTPGRPETVGFVPLAGPACSGVPLVCIKKIMSFLSCGKLHLFGTPHCHIFLK